MKGYNKMISEAAKRATNKYIKNNYFGFSVKIPKDKADQFKALAEAKGDSIRSILVQAIDDYISQHNK